MYPFHFPAVSKDTKERSYTKPVLIAILAFSAILRFSYLIESFSNPMPEMVAHSDVFDQYNYRTMALDLMENNWLGSQNPGHSPVYSYLIAVLFSIFGQDMNVVFIFQILFGVAAVYVFYRCADLLFENKNLALLTAFIAANYIPFVFYECALLRESVIAYTNLLTLYFLLLALRKGKNKNFFLTGAVAGLSLILRAGPLPIVILGYVLWKKQWRACLFVLAGLLVAVAPLSIRNHLAGFKALTETSGPTLFWLGNTYDSPGVGLTYTKTQEVLTKETQGRILKTIEVLIREIKAHPSEYVGLYARKFKMLFNGYEIPANLSYDLFKEQSYILKFGLLNFVVVSPLALFALFLFYKKYKNIGILYLLIFALSAFVFIFHIQARYRIPFIPFYILAASYSAYWFWEMYRTKQSAPILGAILIAIPLVIFTQPDRAVMNRYFNGGIRDVDYANMAGSYLQQVIVKKLEGPQKTRRLEAAIDYYDRALSLTGVQNKAAIYLTKSQVYRDLHMRVHAFDQIEKAYAIDPDNPIIKKEYLRLLKDNL